MSQLNQKDWMSEKNRISSVYLDGVNKFIEFAKSNSGGLTTCHCPCKKCRNRYRLSFEDVGEHLVVNGIDPSYRVWSVHGEKTGNNLVDYSSVKEVEGENIINNGMGHLVDDSYGIHEGASSSIYGVDGSEREDFEEAYVPELDLGKRYNDYKRKAEEKLYPSCEGPETTLSAIVELHNIKKQFGWSGTSVIALLSILRRWLPKGNTLPGKYLIMKGMLKDLGMNAKSIPACENNCILYWKEYENATECPRCGIPRFDVKVGKSKKNGKEFKVPKKVLRHFPLIPRLKRLYAIPWIARDMTWHDRAKSSWDNMRHPADSAHWKMCKEKWPQSRGI